MFSQVDVTTKFFNLMILKMKEKFNIKNNILMIFKKVIFDDFV